MAMANRIESILNPSFCGSPLAQDIVAMGATVAALPWSLALLLLADLVLYALRVDAVTNNAAVHGCALGDDKEMPRKRFGNPRILDDPSIIGDKGALYWVEDYLDL